MSSTYLCVGPFQSVDECYIVTLADQSTDHDPECYSSPRLLMLDASLFGFRLGLDRRFLGGRNCIRTIMAHKKIDTRGFQVFNKVRASHGPEDMHFD